MCNTKRFEVPPSNGIYLEPPNNYQYGSYKSLDWIFLGGSITGAKQWQADVSKQLLPFYNVYNPRRVNYDFKNPDIEREQISLEFKWLKKCGNILFYFAPETLAPITLFELGKELGKFELAQSCFDSNPKKKIFICIHPDYQRKNDVLIQTELSCPKLLKTITFDLNVCIQQIIGFKISNK